MDRPVLENDSELKFPHVILIKASAGSGKTYQLSHRFVQFMLSSCIYRNALRNIVAMTFSNNAAKEMKGRILELLKKISLGDEDSLSVVSKLVTGSIDDIRAKASIVLDSVLEEYSDFQIGTIDSFMATIFMAMSVDFGYQPDFEIIMDKSATIRRAFNYFMLKKSRESFNFDELEKMIALISEHKRSGSSYLWDPSPFLLEEINKLYRISAMRAKRLSIPNLKDEIEEINEKMGKIIEDIDRLILQNKLEVNGNSSYKKSDLPKILREKRFTDLLDKSLSTCPVKQLEKKSSKKKDGEEEDYKKRKAHDEVCNLWNDFVSLASEYKHKYAETYFYPYFAVFESVIKEIEDIKRKQGVIFMEDINGKLASFIESSGVPDIYFRLGETISHFLIDEFQDTSPAQWKNLFPLLENALSERGSFFAVGDTKQAIYSFREADYKIMKSMEEKNPFPSAEFDVRELEINWRSCNEILKFNEHVFKDKAKLKYFEATEQSGLSKYNQKSNRDRDFKGYVEIVRALKKDGEDAGKKEICGIVEDLRKRNYSFGDIAALTQRNEDAVRISSWLSDAKIPFVSFSSLDIRKRRITSEILALLRFLDSPTDNLSFAAFILGSVFSKRLDADCVSECRSLDFHLIFLKGSSKRPFYKVFQKEYKFLWDRYFSDIFRSAGYLPLYDLVTQIYYKFKLFELFEEEEATLIRLLETVKDFEGQGFNNLASFLEFADDHESQGTEWLLHVPRTQDAVQVMTIHKAKGLEFPVAIVMLYEQKFRGFDYVVKDGNKTFSILKVTQKMACSNSALEALYEARELDEMVNSLNSLYVGFTRPERELYVVCVAEDENKNDYPLSILPFESYPSHEKPSPPKRERKEVSDVKLKHRHIGISFNVSDRSPLNFRKRLRGKIIHAILANITEIEGGHLSAIKESIGKIGYRGVISDDIIMALEKFLSNPEVAEFFAIRPGRCVYCEKEFADPSGRLFRVDRLLIDPDQITVIDFKTGVEDEMDERYLSQMENYIRIIGDIYSGKRLFGVIAHVDKMNIRRIE